MKISNYKFTVDWFSHAPTKWLLYFAEYIDKPRVKYLEIGSYEGRSVVWMFNNVLTGNQSSAVCVDIWRDSKIEERFNHNVQGMNLEKRKGESWKELQGLGTTPIFDILYIDGSHEARDVLSDAVLAFRLLKSDGILVFDDYRWNIPGKLDVLPRIGIDAFLDAYAPVIDILDIGLQVAVRKKAF